MPLFGTKTKSPAELVASCADSITHLVNSKDKDKKKASDELSKNLQAIKAMMYGTSDQTPLTEQVNSMAQDMYNHDLLLNLVKHLNLIDFEGRKDVGTIFNNMLRRQIGTRSPTVEYILKREVIIEILVLSYEQQDIALNCGIMLREICRHGCLVTIAFDKTYFYKFFDYVEVSTFDIASDAFSTFKDFLTKHKAISATFLDKEYDKFFSHYQRLLNSENYVTRRQALKLLGELLLDRHNFSVMNKYISNSENLKLMMNMLREKSRNIQFEAFHVFKIFVANPNKTKQVLDILLRNKEKLVDFLSKFHTDRTEDEQFNDEKSYLVKQITELKPMEEEVPAS